MGNAVVLLSGGLDSTTTLAICKDQGLTPYALSFRDGQRHRVELDAAARVASALGVAEHVIADIDHPGEDGRPCGRCDSCQLRAKGFAEAGIPDPLIQRFNTPAP